MVGTYQKADGSLKYFNNFTVRQDGYAKSPITGDWVSYGWGYDFPIDIEGSKHYSASHLVINLPTATSRMDLDICYYLEKNSTLLNKEDKLINSDTGDIVGSAFSESMPIQLLQNGPYEVNQH